jgi:hypothetical protein
VNEWQPDKIHRVPSQTLLLFFIGCDRGSGKDESLLAGEKILMENRASETRRQMTDFALTSV